MKTMLSWVWVRNTIILSGLGAILYCCTCEKHINDTNNCENKMYVYSNSGNTFYLLDYKSFKVVDYIQLHVADTIACQGMILSTNRDFLYFEAEGQYPSPPFGFAIYNINEEKVDDIFFTNIRAAGPAYFISAQNSSKPGLIYVCFRDLGTYSFDLFEKKMKEIISDEHDFDLDKRIFHSPDGKWTIVKKNWEAVGYTELEFYDSNSGLNDPEFVLNKNNTDSLRIYDWIFSINDKIFIMYLPGPNREVQTCLGSYDLETQQLYSSSLKFPWSLSGYYLGYSEGRNEIYAIGNNGRFYIIDPSNYSMKDSINLSVSGEQSQILISPDEGFAFIAYPNSNSIFVINLDERKCIKSISVLKPYSMIIP